jgi:hypothetical protein
MSEYPSSTGVQAKIRRWFDDPSNALIAGEVAVDIQRHLVGIVIARVRPARQKSPLLVDGFPVQAHRRDGGSVHVVEVCAVRAVLGDDLRMHRLALGATRKLGIGTVIRVGIGGELRELVE